MYACICNNLSEEQVREAALVTGTRCAETVYAYLGKKPDCGCCLERSNAFIEEILSSPGEEVSLRKVKIRRRSFRATEPALS